MVFLHFSLAEDEDDKQFITNLYLKHYPLLKKQAYNITGEYGIVDDLIHDAFLKLIPKIPLLRSLSCYKVTSYVVYTVRHVCLDYIRRRSRHTFTGLSEDIANQIPDEQAATEEEFIKHEELKGMEQVLFQLSERDRSLLYYKYNMEMKDREIAELLNIPANHVRQYIARARHRAFLKLSQGVESSDENE
ncbi:MAG: sigma-70 family RNA polymerase sigma factor [Candidatus Carbobacillus altaicus]|nr:sigma-70 family RNA polymerase sigma factor [Candidatus Carbobacillus altaicus]